MLTTNQTVMLKKPTKEYFVNNNRENRQLDRELGRRFRGWEALPGESYTEFKRRFKAVEKEKKIVKAWERKPGESDKAFRRRFKSEKALHL